MTSVCGIPREGQTFCAGFGPLDRCQNETLRAQRTAGILRTGILKLISRTNWRQFSQPPSLIWPHGTQSTKNKRQQTSNRTRKGSAMKQQQQQHEHCRGQRTLMIAGECKSKGTGTFPRTAGRVSACVKVDGDSVHERTLRLTSVRPETNDTKATMTITLEQRNKLPEEIKILSAMVEEPQLKVEQLWDQLNCQWPGPIFNNSVSFVFFGTATSLFLWWNQLSLFPLQKHPFQHLAASLKDRLQFSACLHQIDPSGLHQAFNSFGNAKRPRHLLFGTWREMRAPSRPMRRITSTHASQQIFKAASSSAFLCQTQR